MNLRCIYCQTPFTLSRNEMLTAVVHMNEKNMNHYDAHCPRCRRANSISRQRMELFLPNWQDAAKMLAAANSLEAAGGATSKTTPLPKGAKEAAQITGVKKPAAKKATTAKAATATAKKKPAEKKPAAAKPAAKKAPEKGKKK